MNSKIILAYALGIFSLPIMAQKKAFTIEDLYKIKSIYSVNLSPDKKVITYTSNVNDLKNHKSFSNIYMMDTDGKNVKELTTDG